MNAVHRGLGWAALWFVGCCVAISLLTGCASVPVPQSRAEFEEQVGSSCDAIVSVCKVYEALPADARNARDDATCVAAKQWCTAPAD